MGALVRMMPPAFCASASDAGRIGRHVWSLRTSIYTSVTRRRARWLRATTELALGRVAPGELVVSQGPVQSTEQLQQASLLPAGDELLQRLGDRRLFCLLPLTASARSRSWGSMARLVGMCGPPHINLHTDGKRGGELRRPGAVLAGPSPEAAPVQAPILDRFAHVLRLELGRLVEIGDRARDLEDPVVRPRREREPGDRRA